MHEKQIEIFKKMAPSEKLELSVGLYYCAWEIKSAWLKKLHPDWSEEKLHEEVKEIFNNATS